MEKVAALSDRKQKHPWAFSRRAACGCGARHLGFCQRRRGEATLELPPASRGLTGDIGQLGGMGVVRFFFVLSAEGAQQAARPRAMRLSSLARLLGVEAGFFALIVVPVHAARLILSRAGLFPARTTTAGSSFSVFGAPGCYRWEKGRRRGEGVEKGPWGCFAGCLVVC